MCIGMHRGARGSQDEKGWKKSTLIKKRNKWKCNSCLVFVHEAITSIKVTEKSHPGPESRDTSHCVRSIYDPPVGLHLVPIPTASSPSAST